MFGWLERKLMTEQKAQFPYPEYERALEKVLDQATKDYWAQYIEINRHQVNVARTYLWVSAALLGAYSTIGGLLRGVLESVTPCGLIAGSLAVALAVTAFGLCLYALPARKGYMRVGESWGTFSKMAYDCLCEKKPSAYRDTLTALLDTFDSASMHNVNTNLRRARLLRVTSWVLIISFGFAILALGSIGAQNLTRLLKETQMAKEESKPQTTAPVSQAPKPALQPDARPPQGPITGTPPKIITHAEDPPRKPLVIITEDAKPGSKK